MLMKGLVAKTASFGVLDSIHCAAASSPSLKAMVLDQQNHKETRMVLSTDKTVRKPASCHDSFARAAPAKIESKTQAYGKNLFMSKAIAVNETTLGIKNKTAAMKKTAQRRLTPPKRNPQAARSRGTPKLAA